MTEPPPTPLEHPVPLGPFELRRFVGKGGMGVVWGGVHSRQGLPVAIKVLPGDRPQQPASLIQFRDEVRKVCRFFHPGIVVVFDYGEVPLEAAQQLNDQLADPAQESLRLHAGTPYLVMEYCDGGALTSRIRTLAWPEMRRVLLSLLDALAHAHARGVVHRDLKPDNVLFTTADGEPEVKLTDFGIALMQQSVQGPEGQLTAGTPPFMAPEQFMDWRDQGPGTDLYALGCMAHAMVSGRPPFTATTAVQYAGLHLYATPEPLEVPPGFPRGFSEWVGRLLEKEPRERYLCAAEAAEALALLKAPSPTDPTPETLRSLTTLSLDRISGGDTVPFSEPDATAPAPAAATPEPRVTQEIPAEEPAAPRRDPATTTLDTRLVAPDTVDWRDNAPPPSAMSLVGAGLGLYEWRTIPLVDRTDERDRIWQSVHRVLQEGRARIVLLRGDAGLGKSRLAEWIAQRCLELGLATTTLCAEHDPNPGPRHGLPAAVADLLHCDPADAEDVHDRARSVLAGQGVENPEAVEALAEFVAPGAGSGVRFRTPVERYIALRGFLRRFSSRRPVVLRLNDLQYGADSLGFLSFLTATQDDEPVRALVLGTIRPDALHDRPLEAKLIEELRARGAVETVDVGPLAEDDHDELVRRLLRLEGDLAQQVRERTDGNPLFAIQLVGDWVARRVLDVGETGFVLPRRERAEVPDSIRRLWLERIRLVLAGTTAERAAALQVAAALGREVLEAEWVDACAKLDLVPPTELVDRLVRADLAEAREHGWAFCHGMFQETIRHEARRTGAWAAAHLACVEMLRGRDGLGIAERIGRHLLEAERIEESLEPLLAGSRERLATSDYQQASDLLDGIEGSLERLGAEPTDARWGELWLTRARCAIGLGDYEGASGFAARAADRARRNRWRSLYPTALRYQAMTLEKQGDLGLAETVMFRAQGESTRVGDREGEARCQLHLATISRLLGDSERAQEYGEEALAVFRELDDAHGIADSLTELGSIHVTGGDEARAQAHLDEALVAFVDIGNLFGQARTHNSLAEILRNRGELQEAEERYGRAQELYERVGSPDALIPSTNRALLLVQRGAFDEARSSLVRTLDIAERRGQRLMQAYLHTALLPCAASAADWSAMDHHLTESEGLLSEMGTTDPDLARPAQLAGELAAEQGEVERAQGALRLARDQWRALGRPDRAREVEDAISAIRIEDEPGSP